MPLIVMPPYQQSSGGTQLVISADTQSYNVAAALGYPAAPLDVVLTVNSGVTVYASPTPVPTALPFFGPPTSFSPATYFPAIDGTGLPAGSTLKIINNGSILGSGGSGGLLYQLIYMTPMPAQPGGHAIITSIPTTIDNTNGYIFGGGGGGGIGGYSVNPNINYAGGGGGQGYFGGVGNAAFVSGTNPTFSIVSYAASGSPAAPGSGGNIQYVYLTTTWDKIYGGSGGTWGQAGNSPWVDISAGETHGMNYSQAPGAAGWSINTNGAGLSIIGGNNPNQIKGPAA